MAKTIIFARHGQTDSNKRQIIQGTSDADSLNDFGRLQMDRLTQFLVGSFASFKLWYAPQKRVADAAGIISSGATNISEIVQLDGLSQRNWGVATGQSYNVRSGEVAFTGEPGAPLADDAESLGSVTTRLRKVIADLLRDESEVHMVLGSNEVLNYLNDLLHSRPYRKSTFMPGEALVLELNDAGKVQTEYHIPERLALMINTSSLTAEPKAMSHLRGHGIRVVNSVSDSEKGDVVAVILGDRGFNVSDAGDFPLLRTVARFGSGVNNVDVDSLWRQRRVVTTGLTGLSTEEVSEYALSLIILALRRTPLDSNSLRSPQPQWRAAGRGKSLRESRVGIIGLGRIGQHVAVLLKNFGAKIVAWNRTWPPSFSGPDISFVERVSAIEELAITCDAVSLHLALTNNTHHLLGDSFFAAADEAQNSFALINTARGAICDSEALKRSLENGVVHSACIDVWEPDYPLSSKISRDLQMHRSVLPSCHIAANTLSVRHSYSVRCAHNIIAAVEGRYSEIAREDYYPRDLPT